MAIMCNLCSNPLKNSKYYEVICRDATEHEERLERVNDLENKDKEKKEESRKSNEEELKKEEEKKKRLESYRADLDDMDQDEIDALLKSLRAEIHELRKKLNNPETDEDKQSKEASLEYLAIEPQHNKINGDYFMTGVTSPNQSNSGDYILTGVTSPNKANYSALTYDQNYQNRKSGDKLLMRLGSVD